MSQIKDKVVFIAGGSGGIGSACARLFAKAGAKVVITGRNLETVQNLANELNAAGYTVYAKEMQVTDLASVSDAARSTYEDLGSIDVLINAFGMGVIQPLLDINPDSAKEMIDVNVFGTFLVTQTVFRFMNEQKSGRIIMFPGTMGKYVMKNASLYAATKHALQGFVKGLIEENRRVPIGFTLMYLGGVDTDFWDAPTVEMRVQRDKMLSVDEVAKAVYYAASQPAGSVLNEVVMQPESHQLV
jgi:NADP-dependent 3-hydroxy acid dehydrogenase YdfG